MSFLSDIVKSSTVSVLEKRSQIEALLSSQEVSEREQGDSLCCAALAGDNEIVKCLLANSCDVDTRDSYGFTVLVRLAAGKFDPCPVLCGRVQAWNEETIQTIMEEGPDLYATIGRYRRNALDWSAFNGHVALTDAILRHAAQTLPKDELVAFVNHRSFRRQTPLHLAVIQDEKVIVRHLLQFKGASHSAQATNPGPPQTTMLRAFTPPPSHVVHTDYPVDVNAKLADGNTALHLAVEASNEEMVQIILTQPGVLANERNMLYRTPALKAKEMGNDSLVRMLLPYAIRINGSLAAARACNLSEATITNFYTSDITTSFAETEIFSVHDVLYDTVTETQKLRTVQLQTSSQPQRKQYMNFEFQWVDLPSNNAAWPEVLLTKWCLREFVPEAQADITQPPSSANVQFYTESLAPLFATQNVLKIHSRQLKPDCKMELEVMNVPQLLGRLYMPYLRWQTDDVQQSLRDAIDRAFNPRTSKRTGLTREDAILKAYDIHNSTQLHLRRTLDQYRYPAMSTKERDRDQVVYRYHRHRHEITGNERWETPRIFMVDQLWLWALPKAIITCMPEISDGIGVRQDVIYDLNVLGDQVSTQVDFIALLFTRCLGLFDRHYPENRELRFFEQFEWSLGDITEKATKLMSNFESDIARVTKWLDQKTSPTTHVDKAAAGKADDDNGDDGDDDTSKLLFVNRLINIADETKLHFECLDMDDELVSLSMVLEQQEAVVTKFWTQICYSHALSKSQDSQKARHFEILDHDLAEIKRLRDSIVDVEKILSELLNMKPRYATAIEARFTRDQAEDTARQGQVLMVFTIVTIIFLPLSFLSAFFAINISAFPKDANDQLSLGWVSKYTFGIGIGVSVPLVVVAFAFGEVRIWKERLTSALSRKKQARKSAGSQIVAPIPVSDATDHPLYVSRAPQRRGMAERRVMRSDILKNEELV